MIGVICCWDSLVSCILTKSSNLRPEVEGGNVFSDTDVLYLSL